jgi:hypothetical protein
MSLRPCRECKKEVSDKAKVCPHCGIKWPGQKVLGRGGIFIILIICLWGVFLSLPDTDSSFKEPDYASMDLCRAYIKLSLHFPSSYKEERAQDFSWRDHPGGKIIKISFLAKNGFGIEIPQQAECTIESDGKFDGAIAPR